MNLTAGTTYYFKLWTQDDAGNWSSLSNGATVQAKSQPATQILGHVRKVSSEGITAVLVEAYDGNDALVSSAFTVSDGSGTYTLNNLSNGVYRLQATWTSDGISSSVWLDGIPVGSTDIDFTLEINYTLATIQGSLQSLSVESRASAGFMSVASAQGKR